MTGPIREGQIVPHFFARGARIAALGVVCALIVGPFAAIVTTSFSSQADVQRTGGLVLFPRTWTTAAYRAIFTGGVVTRALLISIMITLVGTALSMLVTTLLAYALSSRTMVGRRWMLLLVLLSLLFSPGLIPSYLTVKDLGLVNSYASLILPTALSGFNIVVVRAFFMNIPAELLQSARIDGAGDLAILTRIVLPLSKAVLAVVSLFYAVSYWNAFFNALIYLNDNAKWPLQMVLRAYVVNNAQIGESGVSADALPPQPALQMAVLVVSIVPILLIYPFIQRHFAKGSLTGAVKT